MSGVEWKPGDVAMRRGPNGAEEFAVCVTGCTSHTGVGAHWHTVSESGRPDWDTFAFDGVTYRPLVAIDPESNDVERLQDLYLAAEAKGLSGLSMQAALREFATPTPVEPTDPTARVTDRRENVWRLLADGEWVCTSGPDIGEYLVWRQLAAERGPLAVEVTQ